MILYSVYINDFECPQRVFQTYEKRKADEFIKNYNIINATDDYTDAFLIKTDLDPSVVESKADKFISEFRTVWLVTVHLYKDDTIEVVKRIKRYTNELFEYAEWKDYSEDYREVTVIEHENPEFLDVSSEEFLKRVKTLIKEWDQEISGRQ